MQFFSVFALLILVSLANGDGSSFEPTAEEVHVQEVHVRVVEDDLHNPLEMGSMPLGPPPRHRQEKANLMKRIDRTFGTWGTSHARYRLLDTLFGFLKYRERSMAELDRWRGLYKNLSKKQRRTLEHAVDYKKKLDMIEESIYQNEVLYKSVVANAMDFYEVEKLEVDAHIKEAGKKQRQADKVSVLQSSKHFVRDWADEGKKERDDAYPCIVSMLSSLPTNVSNGDRAAKVLLPGAGLGRLGHEIADLGNFEVTINEWSMYMNVLYRYLEARPTFDSFGFHPFVDGLSHHATTADLLRKVTVPNRELDRSVLLVEGDFTTVFADQTGHYDILVTHFFIDTARNLISYFETIHRLLRPGGYWINFGPLLYGTGPFVQLSLDEILALVERMGFVFEEVDKSCGELTFKDKKIRGKEAEYGFNGKALTKNAYLAQAWVARKI